MYFEKVLKGETAGVWVLNVQLASYGILIALTGVWFSDGDTSASGNRSSARGAISRAVARETNKQTKN